MERARPGARDRLGRERPRARGGRGARALSAGHARRDRRGHRRAARRWRQRPHGHARRARARAHPRGARRHRRADVVGPRRARRGRRRGGGPRPRRGARRDGTDRAALRALLEDLPAPARHLVQPALAQRRRARAGVDRRPRAPDRGRRPAADRARGARDVRRALRHPRARRARVRQLVRGRRGVPRRLLLPPRRGADLLLQPRRPGLPDLPRPRRPARDRQRRRWAAPRPGVRRAVPGSPESPRGWFEGERAASRACASASSASAGRASSTSPPTTRCRARRSSRSPGSRSPCATELADEYGIEHRVARWEDLLELDGLDAVSVAVPTFLHAPIAIAALERGLHVLSREADRAQRGRGDRDGRRPRARPAACSTSRSTTASAATSRSSRRSSTPAGSAGPTTPRRGGCAAPASRRSGSWFTSAELAGGGPLVDIGVHVLDYSLFLLGNPAVTAVSASTYDLLGSAGFGSTQTRARRARPTTSTFDVEDLATVFMRLADGGTLLVEASWAAHRADGDEFGITLYGTEGGAELIVDDYAPSGSLRDLHRRRRRRRATTVPVHARPRAQGRRRAVPGEGPLRRRRRPRRRRRGRARPRRRRLLPLGRRAARDPPGFLGVIPEDGVPAGSAADGVGVETASPREGERGPPPRGCGGRLG